MESDTSEIKKPSLEELSKSDIIKKYNNLLGIAKKAKQSKDESVEELKKTKENELKLTKEIEALREIVESFNKKQTQLAELENKIKQVDDKNVELKNSLQQVEDKYALKIIECTKLEETLHNLSDTLAKLEEKYSENLEKLDDFKENYAKVDIERKLFQEKLLFYEAEHKSKQEVSEDNKKIMLENKKIKEELTIKENKIKELYEELSNIKQENNTNFEKSKNKTETVISTIGRLDECKIGNEENLNIIKKLQTELDEKSNEILQLKQSLGSEKNQNKKLKDELNKLIESSTESFEEKQETLLKSFHDKHQNDLLVLHRRLEDEKDKFSSQIKELKENNASQKKNYEKEIKNILSEKERIEKLLENHKVEAELINIECRNVNEKLKLKNVELEESLKTQKTFESEIKKLYQVIEELKSKPKPLSFKNPKVQIIDCLKPDKKIIETVLGEKNLLDSTLNPNLKELLENFEVKVSMNSFKGKDVDENEIGEITIVDKTKLEIILSKYQKNLEKQKEENEELGKEMKQKLEKSNEWEDNNLNLSTNLDKNKLSEAELNEISIQQKKAIEVEQLLDLLNKTKNLKNTFGNDIKVKLKTFQDEQNQTIQNIEEVVFKYVGQLHNWNSELLSEMNDMNQALKERGESISKFEQVTENQRKELEEANLKINSQSLKLLEKKKKFDEMEEEINKAKLEVESKHKAMREMEEEMWKMKNDNHSETLSTSTLSRADESARLSELEETFEERYSKLKVFAVKLKKKVTELQTQVEAEREKLNAAESDYQTKVTGYHNQIKSLRNIQSEYDNLQDILDEERKEKNCMKKTLEIMQQEVTSLKYQLEESNLEKEKLKSDKISFEKIKKELTSHIGELKQTIDKQKKDCSSVEREIEELRNQVTIKDRHIEEEKEKHKTAILLLEEQKIDSRKHSVLELEIAAYEKTAEDLKKRLDLSEKRTQELENIIESEKQVRKSLEETIEELLLKIKDEQTKTDTYTSQLNQINGDLNAQKEEVLKKVNSVKALEQNLEEKNKRIESLSLQLEEVTKDKFKIEGKFREHEEKHYLQIHSLEEKVSSLANQLNQTEMELEEMKKEYAAYKVRAQSVLRQSQKELNPSKQQNVIEELEQMKSTSNSLKSRLEESSKKMQKLSEENCALLDEKKRLFSRVQDLNIAVTDLRNENQILKEAKQKENEEHAEAFRIQKLQADTLAQCFQKQIEDLEGKHNSELEEVKKELEEIRKRTQIFFKPDVRRNETSDARKISGFFPVKPEKEPLDFMLLEREECEGSESIDSISPQATNNSNLIPLEQLLNDSDLADPKSNNEDLAQLQDKLEKNENRIKHLSMLLAEAESDSARISQLNEVLKEEIRRLQRSLDREKHAQNFEYLKNVIIKFVSLQSVDEKLRLVPVLNTILKLSPEEENLLTNCAKGIQESASKGWGINLSIWPGG